jgi:hypothetical protein
MLAPETPAETILRLRAMGWGPAKILAGLGHPGYGAQFSARAIERILEGGVSVHQVVYSKGL